MPPSLRLHYFNVPGRAEVTRLILTLGKVPYEDVFVEKDQWPEMKAKMPFGQVPVLEVDGNMLAQSAAIERYAAKLAGLEPTDPWAAAQVDEIVAFITEVFDAFVPISSITDEAARSKARQDIVEGAAWKAKLDKLTTLVAAAGNKHLTGSATITYADILLYKQLSSLASGSMDGVPKSILDGWPVLKAYHNKIAALPAVAARYAATTQDSYKILP